MVALSPATVAALDDRLAAEQADRRLPSVTAALVRDGAVVWSGAAGHVDGTDRAPLATPDVAYRIGSITKTFVAVQVLRLRDEGRLDLGDRVGRHLPELDLPVTVAQLLTHTSGLEAETRGPWWERTPGGDFAALLASRPRLLTVPGTRFHYSNVGFAVLGELVSRLRGAPWAETVAAELLGPLGMHRTTTRPDADAAPGLGVHPFADLALPEPEHDAVALGPAGQLWSSAHDLARWAAFVAGSTDGLLAEPTRLEMLRPVAVNDVPGQAWGGAHALGWQVWNVGGRRYVGHGGSMPGFLAALRVDASTGDGVVLLANATSGLGPAATDLLELLRTHEPRARTPWVRRSAQTRDLDLVGDWFWGTYRFTLTLTGAELRLGTPGEGRGARFARVDDGDQGAGGSETWLGLEGYYAGETLAVRRGPDGRATQLDLASFAFTRTPYDPAADVPGGVDPGGFA